MHCIPQHRSPPQRLSQNSTQAQYLQQITRIQVTVVCVHTVRTRNLSLEPRPIQTSATARCGCQRRTTTTSPSFRTPIANHHVCKTPHWLLQKQDTSYGANCTAFVNKTCTLLFLLVFVHKREHTEHTTVLEKALLLLKHSRFSHCENEKKERDIYDIITYSSSIILRKVRTDPFHISILLHSCKTHPSASPKPAKSRLFYLT